MMPLSLRQRALLRRCGAIVLFAGICLGAFIYWSAPQGSGDLNPSAVYGDAPLAPDDSRRYAHDMEAYSGKVGLLLDKWTRALREPKPLAVAIIVVSSLAAGGCFLLGAERR